MGYEKDEVDYKKAVLQVFGAEEVPGMTVQHDGKQERKWRNFRHLRCWPERYLGIIRAVNLAVG